MVISSILKFFSKKKEVEIYTINQNDLPDWVITQTSKNFEDAQKEIELIRKEISEEKQKTEENLQKLLEAELKVKGIPEKAKQIVEGNRKTYPHKVRLFLEKIELPENLEDVSEFCVFFDKHLDDFSNNTTRNYTILKDIIGEEAATIATNLSNFNNLIKRSKKVVQQSGIEKRTNLLNKTKIFQRQVEKKECFSKDVGKLNLGIKEEILGIENLEKSIKEIEESKNHINYLKLIDNKKVSKLELQNLESQFSQQFSVFVPALKKYERLTLDKDLVKSYLNNLVGTLLEDKGLKIVEILNKMKLSIVKGEIELKDKKKDKILKNIDSFDKTYFNNFITNYNGKCSKLNELISELGKVKVIEELDKLKKDLETVNEFLINKRDKLDSVKKEEAGIDIDILKKEFEQEISENFNKKINITV